MKPKHKSRTINFGALVAFAGALQVGFPYIQQFVDPKLYGYTMLGIGLIIVWLRLKTSEPVA